MWRASSILSPPSASATSRSISERGSSVLYTRWPKPMSRSPRSTAARSHGSARSAVPISSSICSARLGAPPCSGPDSAPIAPTTAAPRSAPVEVMTRAVNVDALKPWSIVEMRYFSTAGRVLGAAARRRASCRGSSRRSRGRRAASIGSRPWRSRHSAQISVGTTAHVDIALSRSVGVVDVVRRRGSRASRRTARPRCAARRAARTSSPARAIAGSTSATAAGIARRGRMSAANASRSASVVGQLALEQQVPDVFERALLREVDGAVLAVVVEAFEAAHVADGRVGDDDAFEALRDFVRLRVGGLDHRDAHEVAHRHDADELAARRRPGCGGSRARRGARTRRAPRRRGRSCRGRRSSTPRPSRSTRRSPRPRGGSCRAR